MRNGDPVKVISEYQTNLRTGTENYVSLLFFFFLLSFPLILSFSKFEVLRISPTALYMLSKHCNTELYPQTQYFLYCLNFYFIKLSISIISSHIFPTNWISTFSVHLSRHSLWFRLRAASEADTQELCSRLLNKQMKLRWRVKGT